MPRYFFDIVDGAEFKDDVGVEFATADDAKLEGAVALAWMMAEGIREPGNRMVHIIVRDETHRALARVMMSLKIEGGD
jgi:hypothetical protein